MVTTKIITSTQTLKEGLIPVSIFPNPAKDVITFSNLKAYKLLEISDLNGMIRKTLKLDGTNVLEVLLVDLQPGIYIVRFSSDRGSIVSRIIKYN